jgi:hypothetical protein
MQTQAMFQDAKKNFPNLEIDDALQQEACQRPGKIAQQGEGGWIRCPHTRKPLPTCMTRAHTSRHGKQGLDADQLPVMLQVTPIPLMVMVMQVRSQALGW